MNEREGEDINEDSGGQVKLDSLNPQCDFPIQWLLLEQGTDQQLPGNCKYCICQGR
jgi:hypothetical protein